MLRKRLSNNNDEPLLSIINTIIMQLKETYNNTFVCYLCNSFALTKNILPSFE